MPTISTLTLVLTPTAHSQNIEVHGVQTVTIDFHDMETVDDFYDSEEMDDITTFAWDKLDSLASLLPDLHQVVLGFLTQDSMSRFVDEIVDVDMKMENLRSAGKLKYAIWSGSKRWTWCRVSPDMKELEGKLSYLLLQIITTLTLNLHVSHFLWER